MYKARDLVSSMPYLGMPYLGVLGLLVEPTILLVVDKYESQEAGAAAVILHRDCLERRIVYLA